VEGHQKAELKKCPECNSISSDDETSCGVCGASLSEVQSEDLEQLVHSVPEVEPNRELNKTALALTILGIILALSMIGGGIVLLIPRNILGLFLVIAGAALLLSFAGGPVGWGGGGLGRRAMWRAEVEEEEKERRRRTGEED
jgi:hypothetical protein